MNKKDFTFEGGEVYDDKITETRYWIVKHYWRSEEVFFVKQTGKNGKVENGSEPFLFFEIKPSLELVGKCGDFIEAMAVYNSRTIKRY
jgi:hypothetical protein